MRGLWKCGDEVRSGEKLAYTLRCLVEKHGAPALRATAP